MPKYVIERGFAEQLDLTSDDVKLIEEVNADEGVRWLFSFLSADRYRTYCLYEAPSPDAIIAAAKRAGIPADAVTEVNRVDGFFRAKAPVEQAANLNEMLSAKGVYLSELTPWQQELEDYFLELTGTESHL